MVKVKVKKAEWRNQRGTRCNGGRTGRRFSHIRRRA